LGKIVAPGLRLIALLGLSLCGTAALAASEWTLARSAHAEVYSQAGEANARSMALLIERLHMFFAAVPQASQDGRPPVRVVVFRSTEEYESYRLRPAAGAYYMGTERRDYIVMPSSGDSDLRVGAHEYWHVVARNAGLELPLWLEEGLAECLSNFRFGDMDRSAASKSAFRLQTLRGHIWMPLSAMLALPKDSPTREERDTASLFYAQSWALTEMLLADPGYRARFAELVAAIATGMPSEGALITAYGKPLAAIEVDLRSWVERGKVAPVFLPEAEPDAARVEIAEASPLTSGTALADVLEASGHLDRAEALYRRLAAQEPDDPNVDSALARIAFQKGENESARELFRRAADHGFHDDDALYKLALLENNAGEHEAALADLRAIRQVPHPRRFAYWEAVAYAANQLGKRDEAVSAANNALVYASNETERAQAGEQRLIAQTDIVVQFERDANGQLRLVNRRAAHDSTEWNPFIEPGDQVRRVVGQLKNIDCGTETVFRVETAAGLLHLVLPDPQHVLMRNAPSEYTCGPQVATEVSVVYAASGPRSGILRGLEFRGQ
jgi:tetratricopeptide (TPR) repeat protein